MIITCAFVPVHACHGLLSHKALHFPSTLCLVPVHSCLGVHSHKAPHFPSTLCLCACSLMSWPTQSTPLSVHFVPLCLFTHALDSLQTLSFMPFSPSFIIIAEGFVSLQARNQKRYCAVDLELVFLNINHIPQSNIFRYEGITRPAIRRK
jgi:hypothetical protein